VKSDGIGLSCDIWALGVPKRREDIYYVQGRGGNSDLGRRAVGLFAGA